MGSCVNSRCKRGGRGAGQSGNMGGTCTVGKTRRA